MTFGVCGDASRARIASTLGFDYVEGGVQGLLHPEDEDAAFDSALGDVRAVGLPCPVTNGFVPGHHRITGPDASLAELGTYVTQVFRRAKTAGVHCIVFGSGGARRVPDGVKPDVARGQIQDFLTMLAPIAVDHEVTVVVEPLNLAECNILTSVDESAEMVRAVNHPGVRLLVDAYHMMKDDDPMDSIARHADIITHAHVATVPNRKAPGVEPCDGLAAFFNALRDVGYDGGVSIEGRIEHEDELRVGLAHMRELAGAEA